MSGLWVGPDPDPEAILAKRDEAKPLRLEILSRRVEFRLAVLDLLTFEQRAALADLINR